MIVRGVGGVFVLLARGTVEPEGSLGWQYEDVCRLRHAPPPGALRSPAHPRHTCVRVSLSDHANQKQAGGRGEEGWEEYVLDS